MGLRGEGHHSVEGVVDRLLQEGGHRAGDHLDHLAHWDCYPPGLHPLNFQGWGYSLGLFDKSWANGHVGAVAHSLDDNYRELFCEIAGAGPYLHQGAGPLEGGQTHLGFGGELFLGGHSDPQ